MITIDHILYIAGSTKALLLLLGNHLLPPDDEFELWLNADGFKKGTENEGSKKHLFLELNKLKIRFRKDLNDQESLKDENGNSLSPLNIHKLIQGHKNRISKVRLMIQHELLEARNLHKPSGVTYIVIRTYWIDSTGKKFRKFAKNLGPSDKVLKNNKVPQSLITEIDKELTSMMWVEYQSEYPK